MATYPAATDGGGLVLPNVSIVEGSNAAMGLATLVGGTVTVTTNKIAANSRVFVTRQTAGGTPGDVGVSARTPGTSFVLTSTSASDTSQVAWWIVAPGV